MQLTEGQRNFIDAACHVGIHPLLAWVGRDIVIQEDDGIATLAVLLVCESSKENFEKVTQLLEDTGQKSEIEYDDFRYAYKVELPSVSE